ncbi:unnamed protein product [Rangifer tarandus platyrhynchus]|uniref:Uncharacterized protein n=1 Tax=Rangifer tarandus platyrhynchus TaxID=3082113 RepID=A0ABN8ZDX2_RANTA|nr:unnamed protein product [Rangifer tarandus platyrhynchus]
MLGSPGARQGEVLARETGERAGAGERARRLRGSLRGGGGRSRRGGGKRRSGRSGPLAGSCGSPSGRLLAAGDPRGAISRPETPPPRLDPRPGGPSRRGAHVTRGPGPRPPRARRGGPGRALQAREARGGVGRTAGARGRPRAGSGFEAARGGTGSGLSARGSPPAPLPIPGSSPSPRRGGGEVAIPGEPRAPPGGTGFEFILGIGRIRGSVWALGNSPPATLPALPAGSPGENPPPTPAPNLQVLRIQSSPLRTPAPYHVLGGWLRPPFRSCLRLISLY